MKARASASERWVAGADRQESRRTLPFSHDVARPCLPPPLYEELEQSFPEPVMFHADARGLDHRVLRISSQRLLDEPVFAPCWKHFVRDHTSQSFWSRLIEQYGASMREAHSGLEYRVGKPLEQWRAVRRGSGARGDVTLECQLVINTPVLSEASSVNGPHIDQARKLWTGLLYMREPGDSTVGGDLELHEAPCDLRFDQHHVPKSRMVRQSVVGYAANSFVGFVNSLQAVHSVSPRTPSHSFRRYVDFVAELEAPVFAVPQISRLQLQWFRLLHRGTGERG